MLQIKFRKMDKSEIAREAVEERLTGLIEKFPCLKESRLTVTLEMENSQFQAGPDLFKVRIHVSRGRYDGIMLEKANSNMYVALADLADHMLEALNRFGDRERVKGRTQSRRTSIKTIRKVLTEQQRIE